MHGYDAGDDAGQAGDTVAGPVKLHHQLSYDFLVLAVGARCNTFGTGACAGPRGYGGRGLWWCATFIQGCDV